MEKRKSKRYKTRQIAKIGGKLGVVNDVSDTGVQISTALSPKTRKIDISFESCGQLVELIGIIQWIKWKKKLQSPNEMGVLIKDATPEYMGFIKTCVN